MDNILSSHQPQGLQTSPQPLCWAAASGSMHPHPQPSPSASSFGRVPSAHQLLCTEPGILRYFLELLRQDSGSVLLTSFPPAPARTGSKITTPSRPSSWLRGPSSPSEQDQDPSMLSPPCVFASSTHEQGRIFPACPQPPSTPVPSAGWGYGYLIDIQ